MVARYQFHLPRLRTNDVTSMDRSIISLYVNIWKFPELTNLRGSVSRIIISMEEYGTHTMCITNDLFTRQHITCITKDLYMRQHIMCITNDLYMRQHISCIINELNKRQPTNMHNPRSTLSLSTRTNFTNAHVANRMQPIYDVTHNTWGPTSSLQQY